MACNRHYLSVPKMNYFIKNMDTMIWILVGDGYTKMTNTFPAHKALTVRGRGADKHMHN